MHGMHVAGTVGANGDEENGGIKGVAPEAQIWR
ncbi:S8 family serine peptidase [Oceanobacillus sp. 143]|nr:S8 family serine peptidase [Oceanobacillus sp. 143]